MTRQGGRQSDTRNPVERSSAERHVRVRPSRLDIATHQKVQFVRRIHRDGVVGCGLAHVVQGPEGGEVVREGAPDELIVTLGVALVQLVGVVGAWVLGVLLGVLLLARKPSRRPC